MTGTTDTEPAVMLPLGDARRLVALAELTDDVSLDESKARARARQLCNLAERQQHEQLRMTSPIQEGCIIVIASSAVPDASHENPEWWAELTHELEVAAGHDRFVVLACEDINAIEVGVLDELIVELNTPGENPPQTVEDQARESAP